MKHSLLLFTNGAALEGQALEDFISEDDEGPLHEIYEMFGQRHHVFDNVAWGQEQVQQLLQKIDQLLSEPASSACEPLALGPPPPELKEMRLVLLGLAGAGKSSSGNSILGSDKFKARCGFNAVSTEAKCNVQGANVLGREVYVVDTPGFSDVGMKPKKLFKCIMRSVLQLTAGPQAFIIVVRVGRVGMRKEAKLLELIPRLFDLVASKFTMVLFTHGDDLGGEKIETLIEENSTMSTLVEKCDQRYMVFNNKSRAILQIEQLFKMIDAMVQASGQDYCDSRIFKLTTAEEIRAFLKKKWKEIRHFFTRITRPENREGEMSEEQMPLM
uniref:AIG1-type G domain-containing protein n=1 Tax=Neogobius melanostomus TaxID=47308 RepID=A0A8C6UBF1_9GOBI